MNEALLGANWLPFSGPTDQVVDPPVGLPSGSAQVNEAPPHSWTSMARWRLYQARSAGASFALKKMPPMPVTRFTCPSEVRLMARESAAARLVRPQPAERRAGDQGVDDAVERVRHREARALAPPDPVLPERYDVAAESDDPTHAEHFEERRARSVRAARDVGSQHRDEERIDEPLAEHLAHV